jgi:predicted neutral ceramidase superfamily lipid hydrolase
MIEGENEFMTDVLFYQNYTYVADISAIVLCIICWLLLHSSYTVREKSLIIFKAGTVCLMMATVCSISFHTAITRITESRKILIYVLQDGIYLLLILTFVPLCHRYELIRIYHSCFRQLQPHQRLRRGKPVGTCI